MAEPHECFCWNCKRKDCDDRSEDVTDCSEQINIVISSVRLCPHPNIKEIFQG